MRVLIACEYSGVVREAFAARGHDAWSCDLLPSLIPGQHIQDDVRAVLGRGWDLMIAHPPCKYLSYAGVAHWNKPGRAELREAAMQFFMEMVNAPIPRICVENPKGYPNTVYRKPDQRIDPYLFGDAARKRTYLWLKNMPKLVYGAPGQLSLFGDLLVNCGEPAPVAFYSETSKQPGKPRHWTNSGYKDDLERSKTFPGIAAAMAAQWG